MKFTTRLEQHSQAIRLVEHHSYAPKLFRYSDGILTLYDTFFQRTYRKVKAEPMSRDYNSEAPLGTPILTLSSSRFTRRY